MLHKEFTFAKDFSNYCTIIKKNHPACYMSTLVSNFIHHVYVYEHVQMSRYTGGTRLC